MICVCVHRTTNGTLRLAPIFIIPTTFQSHAASIPSKLSDAWTDEIAPRGLGCYHRGRTEHIETQEGYMTDIMTVGAYGPDEANGREVARTLGNLMSYLYGILEDRGQVHVEGYERAVATLAKGNVIVAANHPDGLMPFGLSAVFHDLYEEDPRYFLWNAPRGGIVPTPWLRRKLRCVLIDRGDSAQKAAAAKRVVRLLKSSANFVMFPEGTRTNPGDQTGKFVRFEDRVLRTASDTGVPLVAKLAGATILPVWTEIEGLTGKPGLLEALRYLLCNPDHKVNIYFGEPYVPPAGRAFDLDAENHRLEQAILRCGYA